jgi:hypothetical protein
MRWVDSIVGVCKGQVPGFSVSRSELHINSEPKNSIMKLHLTKQQTAEQQNTQPQNFQGWFRLAQSFL